MDLYENYRKEIMGYFSKDEETESVEREIASILARMETMGVESDKYPNMIGYLERLDEIKRKNQNRISLDTVAVVGGNVLVAILILTFEQRHVITSKSMNLLQVIRR